MVVFETLIGAYPAANAATPRTPPRSSTPQPNNYKEGAEKLGEAFLKTDVGKKLQDAATQDPLVKGASDFIGTLPGKIMAGAAATGAIAGLAAEHKALPVQIPEIPLDKVAKGLKVKITYEGPVDRPTKGMITFSYTPGGDKKKPGQSDTDRIRADTARLNAEREQIRAHTTYQPGSPEDLEQKAMQKAIEDVTMHRGGMLPGTGGVPLKPGGIFQQPPGDVAAPGLLQQQLPNTGLRLPKYQSPFAPKTPTLLDKQLELKPITSEPGATQAADAQKKDELPVQRKAESNAPVPDNATEVDDALHSSSRPLDESTRRFMESRLGFDFSKVRIHTDARAAESAKAVHALAYTVGDDIVFSDGRYTPNRTEGRRLLAHELTHTVQQQTSAPLHVSYPPPFPHKVKNPNPDQDVLPAPGAATTGAVGMIPLGEAAENLRRAQDGRTAKVLASGSVRFRVPTTADLRNLFTSGKVPQDVLKDRIELALKRMAAEKRLSLPIRCRTSLRKSFPLPERSMRQPTPRRSMSPIAAESIKTCWMLRLGSLARTSRN